MGRRPVQGTPWVRSTVGCQSPPLQRNPHSTWVLPEDQQKVPRAGPPQVRLLGFPDLQPVLGPGRAGALESVVSSPVASQLDFSLACDHPGQSSRMPWPVCPAGPWLGESALGGRQPRHCTSLMKTSSLPKLTLLEGMMCVPPVLPSPAIPVLKVGRLSVEGRRSLGARPGLGVGDRAAGRLFPVVEIFLEPSSLSDTVGCVT